nr:CopG family transcriptional regulator [Nitrosomonas nitrosa]
MDIAKARRPLQKQRRVNVDFPDWMIESLDKEASRLGVTRQSIIKVWLAERLEQLASSK